MNLLICPQYPYPANHAVVNTVYEGLLPLRGHTVHMVRPMAGITRVQQLPAPWANGSLVVYPDAPVGGRLSNVARSIRQSRWVEAAMNRLRGVAFDAVLVRNDLATASAALRNGFPASSRTSAKPRASTLW